MEVMVMAIGKGVMIRHGWQRQKAKAVEDAYPEATACAMVLDCSLCSLGYGAEREREIFLGGPFDRHVAQIQL
ncbi:hypothetical protein NL676_018119 [Syzygium grande]|nr:hypothetical protein NL676_018119 [Syzygium grande]